MNIISCLLTFLLHTVDHVSVIRAEPVTSELELEDSDDQYMHLDQVDTVEGFMKTREFKVKSYHMSLPISTQIESP